MCTWTWALTSPQEAGGGEQDCQVTLQGLCSPLINEKNIGPCPGVKVKVTWRGSGSFSIRAGGVCWRAGLGASPCFPGLTPQSSGQVKSSSPDTAAAGHPRLGWAGAAQCAHGRFW